MSTFVHLLQRVDMIFYFSSSSSLNIFLEQFNSLDHPNGLRMENLSPRFVPFEPVFNATSKLHQQYRWSVQAIPWIRDFSIHQCHHRIPHQPSRRPGSCADINGSRPFIHDCPHRKVDQASWLITWNPRKFYVQYRCLTSLNPRFSSSKYKKAQRSDDRLIKCVSIKDDRTPNAANNQWSWQNNPPYNVLLLSIDEFDNSMHRYYLTLQKARNHWCWLIKLNLPNSEDLTSRSLYEEWMGISKGLHRATSNNQ